MSYSTPEASYTDIREYFFAQGVERAFGLGDTEDVNDQLVGKWIVGYELGEYDAREDTLVFQANVISPAK